MIPFIHRSPKSATTRKVIETKVLYYEVPIRVYAKFGPEVCTCLSTDAGSIYFSKAYVNDTYAVNFTCRVYPKEIENSEYSYCDLYVQNNLRNLVTSQFEDKFKAFIVKSKELFLEKFNSEHSSRLLKCPEPKIEFYYDAINMKMIEEEQEPYYLTIFDY